MQLFKKKIRNLIALSTIFLTAELYAFPCYLTLVKDTCWQNYTITFHAIDVSNEKQVLSLVIPAGESWVRSQFECDAQQLFRFTAQYEPAFWKQDEGRIFSSKRYWALPESVEGKTLAWNVKVCYPADCAEVSMPPTATDHCQCDWSHVPDLDPDGVKK